MILFEYIDKQFTCYYSDQQCQNFPKEKLLLYIVYILNSLTKNKHNRIMQFFMFVLFSCSFSAIRAPPFFLAFKGRKENKCEKRL